MQSYLVFLFCCVLLYWSLQILHFFQIKSLYQSCIYQVCLYNLFLTAFARFVPLYHILVILTVFQVFKIIIIFVIMISDLWCLLSLVWESHESHSCETGELMDECCICFSCLTHKSFSVSLHLVSPLYSLKHNNTEISSVNSPTTSLECSSESDRCLNQKLDVIKLRKACWKLR